MDNLVDTVFAGGVMSLQMLKRATGLVLVLPRYRPDVLSFSINGATWSKTLNVELRIPSCISCSTTLFKLHLRINLMRTRAIPLLLPEVVGGKRKGCQDISVRNSPSSLKAQRMAGLFAPYMHIFEKYRNVHICVMHLSSNKVFKSNRKGSLAHHIMTYAVTCH